MANNSTSFNLYNLDFTEHKEELKAFLRTQDKFKDYDFEAPNITVLLDILAYNTYKNMFYYNMVISEAFLDSAQTRDSVLSHAKELNYLPRSKKSSKAVVQIDFEASGESAPYTILKGSPFTSLVKNQSFTFTLPETILLTSSNTNYSFEASIYEGVYLQDSYTVTSVDEFPKYKITNKNVDTSSVTVTVYEDGAEVGDSYKFTDSLLGLSKTSKIFFMQAINDNYYEVLFGDNFFGRKPKIGSLIEIEYRVSSGEIANGAKQFSVDFDPTGAGELTSTPTITVIEGATDGLDEQDTELIRLYAPRYFATQQRAISSDDYKSLVLSRFPGTIDDITVYGGEQVEPKQYGRVIAAIKPSFGKIAPDFIKDEVITYISNKISIPARMLTADPEYFYIEVNSVVQYDTTATDKTANEIKRLVLSSLVDFSSTYLEKFDNDFRYSKFVKHIDAADSSITSNDTQVRMMKKIEPKPNYYDSFEIKFYNKFHSGIVEGVEAYTGSPTVISSSSFYYIDINGIEYPFSKIKDDGDGQLVVYSNINNEEVILNYNIGQVDYVNGTVKIKNLLVSEYGDYISIFAILSKKDIIVNQNNIIFIEPGDASISIIGKLD